MHITFHTTYSILNQTAVFLLLLVSIRNALVICTHKCGFFGAKTSYLLEKVTSSMFLTMKFNAVSFSVLLEQTSEISRTSRAFDEFKELSICRSQYSCKYAIPYLSAARNNEYTCFSNFSLGKLPLYRKSRRDSSSSWFNSGSVMIPLGGALHPSESSMFLKISDLAAYAAHTTTQLKHYRFPPV